MKNHRN